MKNHYCMQCGTQMQPGEIEGRLREQCPNCGWIYYQQLKVGSAVLIENNEGKLLLARRGHEPWKGYCNIPAGYVEVNETPEQAAIRETQEETGLEIAIEKLVGTYFFDDDPRGNGLLLVFSANIIGGKLTETLESTQFEYFNRADLPETICGAGHDKIVEAWRERRLAE